MTDHKLTRRAFLGRAAGMGAGLGLFHIVPASAQGKDGRPAPSNRIVMGFIGLGGMGTGNLGAFLGQDDVQVVAVCDVDRKHVQSAANRVNQRYGHQDCRSYVDFRELLARGDVDAVCQSTPDHWHAIPAIAAARAGIDVYGEKPITHTLTEGRAVADAFRQYGRIWQTGSWQRSRSEFRRACELIRNGRLGRVERIEIGLPGGASSGPAKFGPPPPELEYDLWAGPSPLLPYCDKRVHYNWRHQLCYGGGKLMDWVGHHGDIAHWAMDWDETGPLEIEGTGEYPTAGVWDAPVKYHVVAKYGGGVEMHVAQNYPNGAKFIAADGQWLFVSRGELKASSKRLLDEVIGPNETLLYRSDNHQRNFLECIKTRQPTITPAESAHRAASIGHLGNIAIQVGRKIRWDPAAETIQDDATASRLLGQPLRAPWQL